MAKGKKELTLVMVATAIVVMSSMGADAAASCYTPSFPLDCASFALEERPEPSTLCCAEVENVFLMRKSVGIGGYCKAVGAVQRAMGPLSGPELDLALSIPSKCSLGRFHKKGVRCGDKVILGGV